MTTKLFVAAALAMLIASSANAQTSTSSRRCGNVNGVYTCVTATEGADSSSQMTCKHYGGGASDCSTESKDRAPSVPTVQEVTVDINRERAKAEVRNKSGYRDPGAIVLSCPGNTRMTERDGCQPK